MKRPSSGLLMLGVIHRDREGENPLRQWLNAYRPDAVTVEFSRYGFDFRRSRGTSLKGKVKAVVDEMADEGLSAETTAVDDVLSYLEPSFEFSVASDYCRMRRVPIHLVDLDRYSRVQLGKIDDLLCPANLRAMFSGPVPERSRQERALARLSLERGISVTPYTKDMAARDRHMSRRIGSLMSRSGGRYLHVCGWQHLRDPLGLYESLEPHKAFIYDKTVCF
jgi:hypothetical protein